MNDNSKILKMPHLRDYLSILFERKWLIVLIFLLSVTISVMWNFKAIPVYQASVRLLIEPENPNIIKFDEVLGQNSQGSPDYYSTQYKILASRALADRVVDALHLETKEGYGIPGGKVQNISIGSFVGEAMAFVRNKLGSSDGDERRRLRKTPSRTPRQRAVSALSSHLQVLPVSRTRLVDVVYDSPDPIMAAQIANKVSELYLRMTLDLKFKATREATGWLEGELSKARAKYLSSEQELQAYKETHNIVSLEDRQNIIAEKLQELNSMVTKSRAEKNSLGLISKRLRSEKDTNVLSALPEVMDNSLIESMRRENIDLLNKQSALRKRYKEGHPKVRRLNSQIDQIQSRLNKEMKRIVENVHERYKAASARLVSLENALQEQKKGAHRLSRLAVKYNVLKKVSNTNQRIFEDISKRKKETDLMEGLNTTNIRILDRAEVPFRPVRPQKMRNIFLTAGISLFVGFAVVFFVDYLDVRIKSPKEAEEIVDAPIVGMVSDLGKKHFRNRNDSFNNIDPNAREQFNEIRTMLRFRAGDTCKVIQITSSVPGEGKSLISATLAKVISADGTRVLLIDGDFYREGLSSWFNIKRSAGIFDILHKGRTLSEVLIKYEKTNLDILVCGSLPKGNPSVRIFTENHLKSLVDTCRADYDYILIDSPPLLSVSDPLIWSQCVDGVVMVVDVEQVNSTMLDQATGKLKDLNVKILGLIMNRINKTRNYYYYGYGNSYKDYV